MSSRKPEENRARRSDEAKKRARSLAQTATVWLSLLAGAATIWLGYAVLFTSPSTGGRQGVELLPPTACPDKRPAPLPGVAFADSSFNVRLTVYGCNSVKDATAGSTVNGQLVHAQTKLVNFGLAQIPGPVEVEVLPASPGGAVQTFPSRDGGRGAMVLDFSTSPYAGPVATEGYAQLSLAYSYPGLSTVTRERLAIAFAVLVADGDGTAAQLVEQGLKAGLPAGGAQGLYDAWLASRFGVGALRAALARCQRSCSWPAELDWALRQRHQNPRALERQFVSHAGSARGPAQLLWLLHQR